MRLAGSPPLTPTPANPAASAQLTDHVDRLYRAAWGLCGSSDGAARLVEESFERVLSRSRPPRTADILSALLRALCTSLLDGSAAGDPGPRTRVEGAVAAHELYSAIAELPAEARVALVSTDVFGLTPSEASDALEVPEATLTERLCRARRDLAARVVPELVGERA